MQKLTPNAICLVIDGLHAGYLGAYGNTWLSTPHWDRLASESFLLDAAFIDSPDLQRLYRSYWLGVHAAALGTPEGAHAPSLAARLELAGVETILMTDQPSIAAHELARGFSDVVQVAVRNVASAAEPIAADTEETALAKFFAQVIARLDGEIDPFLLWAHCGSLGRLWDAPLALRHALMEEERDDDAEPVELRSLLETEPPQRRLPVDFDPDEVLGLRRAYAAQVSVLDSCLGALSEALADGNLGQSTLLIVLGARGFPLGEHRQLGWCDMNLHEELIHVPWMIRFPDRSCAASRSGALVQPADLAMTLAAWFGLSSDVERAPAALGRNLLPLARGELAAVRDRILLVAEGGQQALRTPAWLLRMPQRIAAAGPQVPELFVKPDDRWEINEIGDRCAAVAAELEDCLRELAEEGRMTDPRPLAPLSDGCLRGPA